MDSRLGFAKFIIDVLGDPSVSITEGIRIWDGLPNRGRAYYEREADERNTDVVNGRIPYKRYKTIVRHRITTVNRATGGGYTETLLSESDYNALSFEAYVNTLGSQITGYTTAFQVFLEERFLENDDDRLVHPQSEITETVNEWNRLPMTGRDDWVSAPDPKSF